MFLPFTQAQFFDVFVSYNEAVWPVQIGLNLVAVALVILPLAVPHRAGRMVAAGLAALWAWLAIAYHLLFFWRINPAAPLFAAISLFAAAAFLWFGVYRNALAFRAGWDGWKVAGLVVVAFALIIYPLIGLGLGHRYPATPTFGLPCPTTLFTFGLLLMAVRPVPQLVLAGPTLWAFIGTGAAFSLGVTQDLGLGGMALLGVYLLFFRRAA